MMDTSADVFEQILDLEADANGARAAVAFVPVGLPDHLWQARQDELTRTRRALYDAVAALSPDELAAFGAYRWAANR